VSMKKVVMDVSYEKAESRLVRLPYQKAFAFSESHR
jgi:hypothetical protein